MSLLLVYTAPGKGLVTILTGGEEPHVGAVAVGNVAPRIHHPEKVRSTTSVIALLGHLDNKVAVPAAARLSEGFQQPVVVVSGIHVNNATPQDIRKLVRNAERVVDKAMKTLRSS